MIERETLSYITVVLFVADSFSPTDQPMRANVHRGVRVMNEVLRVMIKSCYEEFTF